jgi:lipopolysaccharide/colanic/teichoic acid biosynthesis glycosyltransferase
MVASIDGLTQKTKNADASRSNTNSGSHRGVVDHVASDWPKRPPAWNARRSARFLRKKYTRRTARVAHVGIKRLLDFSVAATVLIVLSPLFLILALLIKLTDRGPVLFWQNRVGRHGREFPFPKFRSMVPNAEALLAPLLQLNQHKSGVTFKLRQDPRITWIGRILRRLSLDELPQFWCVLIGDMSLVGPRPPLPREVAQYTLLERRRLEVTPGLTCIWQISGRGDVPFPVQVKLDIDYIDRQTLWLDLKILVLTVPAVLVGRGAY